MTLPDQTFNMAAILPSERERLVRQCARLSGNIDAAEDLAQETLIEAWRHKERLHNPQGYPQWLSAIAYNVCRRWTQNRSRELAHLWPRSSDWNRVDRADPDPIESLVDDYDLEIELERKELEDLLDRAMSLLPPATSKLLIEKYIMGTSLTDIATRLSVSEGAIAVRLYRGKLALRHVLTTDLRSEATTYGLYDENNATYQETRIWCPMCGQRRLVGCFAPDAGEFRLVCPICTPEQGDAVFQTEWSDLFSGVKGFKVALSRFMKYSDDYYRQGLLNRQVPCRRYGHPTSLQQYIPADAQPSMRDKPGLHVRCEKCDSISYITHQGLVRCLPEARRFWQEHPRIRSLPECELEVDGRIARVTSFQSITGQATLDVVSLRDTFELVSVHQS